MTEDSQPHSQLGAVRLATIVLWCLAWLQGVAFLAGGRPLHRIIGLAVVVGSSAFARAPLDAGRRLAALALLGAIGFVNILLYVIVAPEPVSLRLLCGVVLLGYGALCAAAVGAAVFRRWATGLLVSALAVAIGMIAVEGIATALMPASPAADATVQWIGGVRRLHRGLDLSNVPNSEAQTIYSTNPRGYFKAMDSRQLRWDLTSHHEGSAARLLSLSDALSSDGVRVEIDRAQLSVPWHIELDYTGVDVQGGERYVIAFRARADRPRTIAYGVSQNHSPWRGLGWYQEIAVGTAWRDYVEVFKATDTEDAARVTFKLGASASAVEVESVAIKQVETGANAVHDVSSGYAVSYRFNAQGCRGPDYITPAPSNRRRILALGDSYTLGIGVYQEDTFEARLQTLLEGDSRSARTATTYDVVNCGASGYSTRDARKLFEKLGSYYRPDVVILSMDGHDDTSFQSVAPRANIQRSGRSERLLFSWGLFHHAILERRPASRFEDSLQEVRILEELCARQHARLVVVAFRNEPLSGNWQTLVHTMSAGLAGSDVPWLDLGERLVGDRSSLSFMVQPPDGDPHPNEIAHRSAAEQIFQLIQDRGWLH